MTSLNKKQSGFTIIELLIVIIIIGILAGLVLITFTGINKKARDTERKTDIGAVDSHLEAYFTPNGKYPTLAQLNDSTFRSTNMKGLDDNALQDPKAANNTVAATAAANVYAYVPTPSGCDNTATDCTGFTLTATLENDGSAYQKKSLN